MNYLKSLTSATIAFILSFSSVFFCTADDIIWNEGSKATIYNLAKEQDRFVLMFGGSPGCLYCRNSLINFNTEGDHKIIIEEDYFTWYNDLDKWQNREDIRAWMNEFDAANIAADNGFNRPILAVINPDDPDNDYKLYWNSGNRTVSELLNLINSPNLLSGQTLVWNESRDEVFELAKEQGKKILKLVGKATSPNSKKVMKQLTEEPLKQMLEDNFILWLCSDITELPLTTYAPTPPNTLPYISIINPDEPDDNLNETYGYQDVVALEEMLLPYAVSNEIVASDNKVFFSGNILQIANRFNNEQIQIYTLTGQRIASIRKNDYSVKINASHFPKGALIVYSSSGWSTKIINNH